MVMHRQRSKYNHQWRKSEQKLSGESAHPKFNALVGRWKSGFYYNRTGPHIFFLLFLSLLCCAFIFLSLLYTLHFEDGEVAANMAPNASICSSISYGTICCDRSSVRSDVCFMKGDVRTQSASASVYLYTSTYTWFLNYVKSFFAQEGQGDARVLEQIHHEKIKPYPRKWETSIMDTIAELDLISDKSWSSLHQCQVPHDAPALFFSTGGYTGNVYHDFNDGIIPLYISSQHLNKKVVFVILDYHRWWFSKYGDIISLLSNYPPVDFSGDQRTHCFTEAIVGLTIHNDLTIDSSLMTESKSIRDFQHLLDRAYWPRIEGLIQDEERGALLKVEEKDSLSPTSNISQETAEKVVEEEIFKKPTLVVLSRNGSRVITNEASLVEMAKGLGFQVQILKPDRTTELAKIYRALNSSDVMIGVHGAAMTHFLFLRPNSVFIQVVPLGTEWAAETYYGGPAVKLGLKYISYKILTRESSLYDKYDESDTVLREPQNLTKRGWEFTKKIYLDDQNVRLDLRRFKKPLVAAYQYSISRKC